MKKAIKRYAAFIFSVVLLTQFGLGAIASNTNTFLQKLEFSPGQLLVYTRSLDLSQSDQIEATLGDQMLPATSISTVGEQGLPLTIYCLVDISGSMNANQMEQVRETLYYIADNMGPDSQMIIGTLGNTLTSTDFLSSKEDIYETIGALSAVRSEDTNLYSGIVESLNFLTSDTRVTPGCFLLILSDGEDDQTSGITRSEAELSARTSGVPIYTVATLRESPTEMQQEFAKVLGSFARTSIGGEHFAINIDGMTASEAARRIIKSNFERQLITFDTSSVIANRDELLLSIAYKEQEAVFTDTITISSNDLIPVQDPDSSNETVSASSQISDDLIDSDDLILPTGWIIGIVCVSVFAVLGCIFFIHQKKAKATVKDSLASASDKNSESVADNSENFADSKGNENLEEAVINETPPDPLSPYYPPHYDYQITFSAIGYMGVVHTLFLSENVIKTIGRTNKAEFILDAEDKQLSSVHFYMRCTENLLTVKDMDSKNGTFINGVPIQEIGEVPIHDGNTLRAGSYEYRISIKSC